MDRLTPEIEKAYRNWRRTLTITPLLLLSSKPDGRRGAMTPEHKEKIRRAQLKRWAKKRAA